MAYRFIQIPVRDSGAAEEELNRFLRGHRVLSVERRWVDLGMESYWSFCVDYLERPAPSAPGSPARAPGEPRGKVDYREVLSPEQFGAFVKLRALRPLLRWMREPEVTADTYLGVWRDVRGVGESFVELAAAITRFIEQPPERDDTWNRHPALEPWHAAREALHHDADPPLPALPT